MTPKEKADELVTRMFNTQIEPCSWRRAKVCALIAVDEILTNKGILLIGSRKYWEEVKQEIEKL